MAAMRSRAQLPVGSAQWILEESRLANEFVAQEVEEFAFSAKNEMEWLNEHMAEIFNRSQLDVAEVFKTPGKLRGKTPRTARRKEQMDSRAPLTEVFSANRNANHSPSRRNAHAKPALHFQVAEDQEGDYMKEMHPTSRFSFGADKENTDSGYHDMTEEETDVGPPNIGTASQKAQFTQSPPKPVFALEATNKPSPIRLKTHGPIPSRSDSQDTFVSAVEDIKRAQDPSNDEATQSEANPLDGVIQVNSVEPPMVSDEINRRVLQASPLREVSVPTEVPEPAEHPTPTPLDENSIHRKYLDSDESPHSSETSSPRKSVVRKKSSLTFATLPAREPLATKKSVGARASHADPARVTLSARESQFGKHPPSTLITENFAHHRPAASVNPIEANTILDTEADADISRSNDVSESTKKHNKTSTQRLQERFAMLNKSSMPRTSKSIAANAVGAQSDLSETLEPESVQPPVNSAPAAPVHEETEESWIGPVKSQISEPATNPGPETKKTPDSPAEQTPVEKEDSFPVGVEEVLSNEVGKPAHFQAQQETTFKTSILSYPELPLESNFKPSNSETVWSEGPLSASKARLFSVLKSAKGIFASSASVSAQAKMEALSSSTSSGTLRDVFEPPQSPQVAPSQPERGNALNQGTLPMHEAPESRQHPKPNGLAANESIVNLHKPLPAVKAQVTYGTSSKDIHSHNTLPQAEPMEDVKATHEHASQDITAPDVVDKVDDHEHLEIFDDVEQHVEKPPHPPPKSQSSVSQMQKNGELRRPNRPGKETAFKARPAPVSIRLASQKIGHATSGTTHQEPAPPAVPPKQPMLSKKASNSSIHTTSSTQSFKSAATAASSRPKALEAAARKKEQDEKEALRKAEQKREIEKRRAAKAEEERRAAQEQKAAEQRALEAKQQAHKQALEQRKAEALRRAEQNRPQVPASRSHQAEESTVEASSEQPQAQPPKIRSEAPTIRPVSRMGTLQDLPQASAPHVNPAKPPKRQFNPDMHDDLAQKPLPARPEQQQVKRRRTSEDSFAEVVSRPAMAPPVRPSMIRKDTNSKPPHGFNGSANTSHGPGSTTIKGTLQNLPQAQNPKTPHMNDLAKFSNARIPFADAPNPPQAGPPSASQSQAMHQNQAQRVYHPMKTPTNVPGIAHPPTTHKSSPQYPNGDSIDLPEIATDSEDSDDDNDFVPPEWANSPALRDLLAGQQLADPARVFGPIAPLVMEEVFKGNKDRMARFRNRTSSANWNGPDRLNEEERRRDREARERFERDGGWSFNPGT